ncbi:RHS repeat-associated core domain-containing protein [Actinoallomurus acanthiterrae]
MAVEVIDQNTTTRAHINGLALRLARRDGQNTPARVAVRVDYSAFRYAFGGDWASRLRLVKLPDCALTTPDQPACQLRTELKTANDVKAGTLTADVDTPAPAAGQTAAPAVVLAATAAPSGSAGDYTATSLSPSSTWSVSNQTGGFSWSYPLRLPPSPGGPTPQVALSYSSQAIDGKTVETNNQTSWAGEGFDYSPGYIERRYHSCADDGASPKHNDECWGYDNATLSLNGQSTELIRDDATGAWQPKNDDGSKVEKFTGAVNGDNDGEYWRVTTTDGTQYYFGMNRLPGWEKGKDETNSTFTVPVYGDDSSDPCHKSTAEDSFCDQAWRWNLDYVVDPHGTASTFWYTQEPNYYRRYVTQLTDGKPNGTVTKYIRGGYLKRIDYAVRADSIFSASAPARVTFHTDERCIPTSGFDCAESKFTKDNAKYWPDVPFDQNCNSGDACNDNYAPTFWSRKRLTWVTTQILSGSDYKDVDTWTLHQQMQAPGDGTAPALWLHSITHQGNVGTAVTMPDVVFDGIQLDNRVDTTEGLPPLTKWRVDAISNETGGQTSITYAPQDCTAGHTPSPDSNAKRCFPQYWTPEGNTTPKRDWFHKYVVQQVAERDLTGGAPDDVTTYSYSDPAWHYDDDDGLTKEKYKTWSQFRGFAHATIVHGDASGPQSKSTFTYFQGMDGDKQSDGSARKAKVTDSEGDTPDSDQFEGLQREEIHYDGSDALTGTINDPWSKQTGKRVRSWGTTTSDIVEVGAVHERKKMSDGSWRRTETDTTYDDQGMVTTQSDLGDVAKTGDESCTRTTYARDASKWLMSYPSRVEAVSKACDAATKRPDDVISDVRKSNDGKSWNEAPTKGNVTKAERLDGWDVGGTSGPHYSTTGTSTFDDYGRPLTATDPAGKKTVTAYTPTTGLVTKTTVTNALKHVDTTTVDPSWGLSTQAVDQNNKTTNLKYDGLGRLISVWLPGRASNLTPSLKFDYLIRTNGATAVSTSTLRNDGTSYTTGYALYDGLLRKRQSQGPAPGGGRVLTDTFYDSRGLVTATDSDYYNEDDPGTTLYTPKSSADVPSQTLTTYNGMEWPTAQILRAHANEKWRTTTEYDGERISVIPPNGGTPTTTITDAQGRTVEADQYKGDDATGDHDAVHYTYDTAGRLGTVKDAAGSTWTYHYDLVGRQSQVDDPDKGTTTFTYNNRDLVETVTDARHHKLFFTYDDLARKTAEYENDTNGFKLAEWAYDTAVDATTGKPDLGQPASSTRHVKQSDGSTADYVNAVGSYDDAYRPKTTSVTIPSVEGKLTGTYSTTTEYNLDGTLYRTTIPRAGGLPTETLTYGYDELGDVKTLQGLSTYVTGSTYDKIGQLIQQMMWTGGSSKRLLRTNTIDDGTNRLMQTTDEKETAPTPVDNVNYKYDDAGKVTKIADTPTGQTPDVQCFSYDHLQRLNEAWTATDDCAAEPTKDNASSVIGGAAPYWQSFRYDAVGDRTSSVDHDVTGATAKDVTQTYTYPAADQPHPHSLSSVTTTGGARDGQTDSFTYDDDGNTKTRQIGSTGPQQQPEQDFTWDLEGHLSSVDKGGQTTSFVYDADGNRLIQHAPDASTLYLAGEEVRLATGAKAADCTRYYSFGGQTIAARTTASLTWLVSDPHGTSDVSVSDDATQTVTRRRFTPFGQIRGDQPTVWPGTRGFVGGTIDTALGGLTQLGAREYDTNTGRFLSVDPVFDQSDPQSWNGYAYADNDPTTHSDPSGLHIPTCQTQGECYPSTTGGGNNDSSDHSGGPQSSPPAPTQHHCSWLCGARNFWNKHKATIINVTVTVVVTVGCEAATGGAGSLGCLVVGGMAGNYAGYVVSTPPDQQTLGGAVKAEAVGALTAVASWGAGKAGGAILGKLATTAGGRVATNAIAKAASKVKGALGKVASAVARGEEDAAGGEASAGAKAATDDTTGPSAATSPSARARAGHGAAGRVLEGGRPDRAIVFAGRGEYRYGSGATVVPSGTRLIVYAEHGKTIPDVVGLGIERGTGRAPVTVYGPGDEVPNYTLKAPVGLTILRESQTVDVPTSLSDLLKPRMGDCHWAACTEVR